MVNTQSRIFPEEWDAQTPQEFEIQTDHLISARRPDHIMIKKPQRTCRAEDFDFPGDHREKLKECENRDAYLDLARGLKKKPWNMQVTIKPIVIGALGTVTKRLSQGLRTWK